MTMFLCFMDMGVQKILEPDKLIRPSQFETALNNNQETENDKPETGKAILSRFNLRFYFQISVVTRTKYV